MDLITQILFQPEPLPLPLFAWAYISYLVLIDVLEIIEWIIEEFSN